ncbi:hypothetical protein LEMA_P073280.1 [Plenodomus lingam JN3]|uniref:Uncharacterized protein n=1 Tax=Leptosphaeria maculans (strain JN3 / isolate v23.1.3 / race Av1-4-5-6-7-8) TaxID=985895 RepID=E5A7Z4_LEPMJ|nr:hypothetical protein LEMA_P073280.1 [Plenodomus lingam JN3]CBX99739.1 hypothetical protein LEMA_P073280.1 [Plenodomus lingam JN3]
MPGMLTRSKSLRFLKSGRKDAAIQQNGRSMQPLKAPQTDSDKLRSATPSSGAESRLETPDMAVRPSTSGGSENQTTMFHKKTNAALSMDYQNQTPTFSSFPSFPNSTTTLSAGGDITEEQGVIGIALGSPTVGSDWTSTSQATDSDPSLQVTDTEMTHFQQPNGSVTSVGNQQVPPKSKLSRWKSLFRKAGPPPPTSEKPAFYQLTQTAVAAIPRADSHHDEELSDAQIRAQKEMGMLRKVPPPTYNPGIRASRRGAPEGFIAPRSPPENPLTRERTLTLGNPTSNSQTTKKMQRAFTSPIPPSRDVAIDAPTVPKLKISGSKSKFGAPESDAGSDERSLLDVSIPDVTMERYSIMFGNVLQSSPPRSSSLLQRRQANAEKLKPLDKLSVQDEPQEIFSDFKLPRRATSPAPSGSPRLMLFPSTTPNRAPSPLSGATNSGKVLHRSRTAPAKSPLRQTFAKTGEKDVKISDSTTGLLKPSSGSPYLNSVLTPTSVHSFESDNESITIVVGQTNPVMYTDFREPQWEICSKPKAITTDTATPSTLSRAESQRQPKLTKLSALSSHPSSAPLDVPSPLHRLQSLTTPPLSADRISAKRTVNEAPSQRQDVEVRSVATVGIARSVSVSKANSPRTMLARSQTDLKSAQGERLVERQALTPTMVEVRNRKSQRVQLEMAT